MTSALVTKADIRGFIKSCVFYKDQQFRTKILCVGCRDKNSIGRLFDDQNEYWMHEQSEHWNKNSSLKICHHDCLLTKNSTDASNSTACTSIPTPEASPVDRMPDFSRPSLCSSQRFVDNTARQNSMPVGLTSSVTNITPQAVLVANRSVEDFTYQNNVLETSKVSKKSQDRNTSSETLPVEKNVSDSAQNAQMSTSKTRQEASLVQNVVSEASENQRTRPNGTPLKRKASQDYQSSDSTIMENDLQSNSNRNKLNKTSPSLQPLSNKRSFRDLLQPPCQLQESSLPAITTIASNIKNELLNMEVDTQSETNTSSSNMEVDRQSETNTLTSNMEVDRQSETNILSSNMEVDRQSQTNTLPSYVDSDRQSQTNTLPSDVENDNSEQNLFSINAGQSQTQGSTISKKNNTIKTTTTNNLLDNNSSQAFNQKETLRNQDHMKSKETLRNRNDPQNVQSSNNKQLIQIRRSSCQLQEFKCKECRNDRKFKTEDNLKKHLEKYHGNGKGTFYCEPCEKRISNKAIKKHYDTQIHKENLQAQQKHNQISKRRQTHLF